MWGPVAGPSEYLAITGGQIKDIVVAKAARGISHREKYVKFNVSPVVYTFEFLPFFRPAVFNIGPRVTNHQSLVRYAKLFAFRDEPTVHINDLVKRIIAGQTHILDASVTFWHIWAEVSVEHILGEVFGKFFSKLQLELDQFGLMISKAHLEYAGKTNIKGDVDTGQTKHDVVKIDFETNANGKMKVKVDAGQTKHNTVKADLVNKVIATGFRKVEIKEKTTRVMKIFK